MEMPTPPSRGYTVTMLSCGIPLRLNEVWDLDGHGRVVEDDGENGDPAAHRGLEIEPGHAEGGVAHEIDVELVGRGELGADDEAEPGAERMRLAPAEIAARRDGPVERQELVARAPRVVRDDGGARVDRAHELGDDPIGVDRDLCRAERRRPLGERCRAHALVLGAPLLPPGGAT